MGDERIYEAALNGHFDPSPPYEGELVVRKPLPPLSEEQRLAIAKVRNDVKIHAPEIINFIEAMYREGLIDGWRSIRLTVYTREDK